MDRRSAIALGLSGFLAFALPGGGERRPTTLGWIVVGGVAMASSWSRWWPPGGDPRWWKAAMFGTAAAMSFAFTAALIKSVSDYAANDWVTLFAHWQTYGVIVFGLIGPVLDPERLPCRAPWPHRNRRWSWSTRCSAS